MNKITTIIKNLLLFPCLLILFTMILCAVLITNRVIEKLKMEQNKLFKINKALIDIINNMISTGNLDQRMEEEYKKEIENIKTQSEEILGKRIFAISTGGIVILATIRIQIYRDLITPNQTTVFILAVVCFMLSIIINLYSNYDVAKRISNILPF